MTDYSVLLPCVPRRLEQALPFAGLVQWTGATRLWQGQAMVMEPHQTFTGLAGAGFRVPTGFGVTLMPLRHPYEAALQARSVALATGESVIAGFGPGAAAFQANILGAPYPKPLQVARQYVQAVRGLLDGETVEMDGPHYTFRGQLAPAVAPRVDVGLGVLRPGMARLAGEVADVVITWLTPPAYLREVLLPAVEEGAARAGRTTLPRIVAMVPTGIQKDGREGDAPERLAVIGNAPHMQAPHYLDMLGRAGVDVRSGKLEDVARGVVETGAFAGGDLSQAVKALRAFEEAGVDEIVLNSTAVHKLFGTQETLSDLSTLLKAVVEPH
ncbi:5,10-methylenetetrahydromethanopterin reductase [Streptomyces spiroverticillatus]|uniref:5,10-methylenetetrahydromethanopterin reductase n=1 Tax=Streptomyces finlayi TaxID=67296 RepID=A0A918WTL1_9ACTN|nr:LLM class flavin-dependent oxidoreductase [Streptomyces finlayi]GGZ96115.1 5,10-methylenetetrahydromethanopterin reductase [Streptomyces spiroverticillatus]GHC81642.1 5,10-methylenetetrahydromethanopterin reductase [Streptomyces finlayi]